MKYLEQNEGIRICDFSSAFPAERVSREFSADAWQLAEYETVCGGGTMLAARSGLIPPAVSIPLNLTGWHRLYVCLMTSQHGEKPGVTLKLTDDPGASFFTKSPSAPENSTWGPEEMCNEYFWQCADLTGQTLTVEKLQDRFSGMIGLMWIRAVPMSSQEVEDYQRELARKDTKILHGHTDMDWIELLDDASVDDLFAPLLHDISKSDVGVLSVEIFPLLNDYSKLEEYKKRGVFPFLPSRSRRSVEYAANWEKNLTALNQQAHRAGIKVYAALRMALTQCPFPRELSVLGFFRFPEEHPELLCVDRDGETHHSLSFAYPEVRAYAINELLKVLPCGFDGVTIFTHRGIMTLFEEPVIARFCELYPGVDPRRLPLSDERLVRVHCEMMEGFIRELRQALDKFSAENGCERKAVNIVTGYSCAECKLYGIDVETWAQKGLIDSFIPSNMSVLPEDSRYRDPQEPDLISLEKYKEVKYKSNSAPVKRFYGNSLEKMLKNLPHHLDISRRTGVKCYIEVPWECTVRTEVLHDYVSKLYAAGAENISLWDCFHTRVMNRDEWNLLSKAGHKENFAEFPAELGAYLRSYRVLSYNGISIAAYHPAWRG
ncbi:MAG: hypothetical protein IJZ19_05370 [Lentisphaeria bacterium]|nr:hypothetical protein [Lentisphaeria bacterium]